MTLAVAGFGDDEIGIEVKENLLTVAGKLAKENGANESYLHRGIATRASSGASTSPITSR